METRSGQPVKMDFDINDVRGGFPGVVTGRSSNLHTGVTKCQGNTMQIHSGNKSMHAHIQMLRSISGRGSRVCVSE